MSALPQARYTLEEYLELDRHSEARLEYWDGEIFDMSGVSPQHAAIEVNLIFHLRTKLAGRTGRVFSAQMRLKAPTMPPYRYGDVSALCGQPKFEMIAGIDVLTNPAIIIEVLSPPTEAYDRGDKFTHYKSIPSLVEYLLIAQHRPHLSQFIRQADGSWNQREFNDLADAVTLTTLDCTLQLSGIYENVVFVPQPRTLNPVINTPGSL